MTLSLRGKPKEAQEAIEKDFKMPPFKSQEVNPFPETQVNPTQLHGLDYQNNYRYKYEIGYFKEDLRF